MSLRALPAGKLLTKENVLQFPAWADFVQRLPAGCDSLLHSDLCQLNLTFLLEQFMADIFLGQTEVVLRLRLWQGPSVTWTGEY